MSVSSPAVRLTAFRLVLIAAFAALVVGAWLGGRMLESPLGAALGSAGEGRRFSCEPYEAMKPRGGVARAVATQAELAAGLAAAQPGDTINLASGVYRQIAYRAAFGHRSGTADAPIVIQAAPGASPVIDIGANGGPSDKIAVTIEQSAHVMVRGLEIRHGLFGALSRGSASITFEHNHIHHLGQAGVVTGAVDGPAGYEPSSATVVRCNSIHHTGQVQPEYGEGIYVGTGRTGAVDRTNHVLIEGNEIHTISNEAIDVKRHTSDVTIRHNTIHDITPHYGGAISLGLNKDSWGPANYLVEHNKIWNVSSGRYYAQAIAVAHGPTIIRHNTIWNIQTRISESWPWTAPVQVHGDDNGADWAYGFGNTEAKAVEISDNTIVGCNQGCIDSHTNPGQIKPDLRVVGNIVDRPSTGDAVNGSDIVVSVADLVGPVTGTADSGSGPGSGLRLPTDRPSATAPTTTSPPPTAAEPPSSTGPASTSTRAAPAPAPTTTTGPVRAGPIPPAIPPPAGEAGRPIPRRSPPTPSESTPGSTLSPAGNTRPSDEAAGSATAGHPAAYRHEDAIGQLRRSTMTNNSRRVGRQPATFGSTTRRQPAVPSPTVAIGPSWLLALMTPTTDRAERTTLTVPLRPQGPAAGSANPPAEPPSARSWSGDRPATTGPSRPKPLTSLDGNPGNHVDNQGS